MLHLGPGSFGREKETKANKVAEETDLGHAKQQRVEKDLKAVRFIPNSAFYKTLPDPCQVVMEFLL